MNQVVPIAAVASQSFAVMLGNQTCDINLYQKSTGLFFDLTVGGTQIVSAMLCLTGVGLVVSAYLGFAGQLYFVDTGGSSDPVSTGLGSRFILVYQS